MGFDQDRFLTQVNDGLLCCICRDVLEDPVQAPCEHAYCTACIHGWLVNQTICPEDRRELSEQALRPLFRYMKNDLDSLQIRCKNAGAGCDAVCRLESVAAHEANCAYDAVQCPSMGCSLMMERRLLDDHLTSCQFRRLCPAGCGMPMLSADDLQHSCIAELRQGNELLRSEMICKLEEQKEEAQQRAEEMKRQHESQVHELRGCVQELREQVAALQDQDQQRSSELSKIKSEKTELTSMLRNFLQQYAIRSSDRPSTSREGKRRSSSLHI